MRNKQTIKVSEARILVLLENVDENMRHISAIAHKLGIDYNYALHILAGMKEKKWVKVKSTGLKTLNYITKAAPLDKAKELLIEWG